MDESAQVVRVYLCGGFHSNWHGVVEKGIGTDFFRVYNPKDKEMVHPEEYWPWDLAAIRKSDIVFAYFEKWCKEKCGAGAIGEFGYAVGQNKLVILVNEVNHRYFTQLKNWPNVVYFEKLGDGIAYLRQCRWLR